MPNRRLRGQLLNIPEDVRSALAGHYRRRHAYGDIQPRAVIPRKSIRGGGVVLLITIMYYVITGLLSRVVLVQFSKREKCSERSDVCNHHVAVTTTPIQLK